MFVKISTKPVDILIVIMYKSTKDHEDERIEKMYHEFSATLHQGEEGECHSDG